MSRSNVNQADVPAFTPEEASKIFLGGLASPHSNGLGALDCPTILRSFDVFYRIRITMLREMRGVAPGPSLDAVRDVFLSRFAGSMPVPGVALFKAQWKYLADTRNAVYQGLRSALGLPQEKRKLEAASLMRAFADPFHRRKERVDFALFQAYIEGFTDEVTLAWLSDIWNSFQLGRRQTFFRRVIVAVRLLAVRLLLGGQ